MLSGCFCNANNDTLSDVIPDFTREGLLPPGEYSCSWTEFVTRFEGTPDNGRRRQQMLGLGQMLLLLGRAGCLTAFVDGSFVTREKWPRDFDLCYLRDVLQSAELDPTLRDVSEGRRAQKSRFGGEAMPADFPISWNGVTILEAFGQDRITRKAKGLIRLELQSMLKEIELWIEEQQQEAETL